MSKLLTSLQVKTSNFIKLSLLVEDVNENTTTAYDSMCNIISDTNQCSGIPCSECVFNYPLGSSASKLNAIMEKVV